MTLLYDEKTILKISRGTGVLIGTAGLIGTIYLLKNLKRGKADEQDKIDRKSENVVFVFVLISSLLTAIFYATRRFCSTFDAKPEMKLYFPIL